MFKKLKDFLLTNTFLLPLIFAIVAVIATVQQYAGGIKKFEGIEGEYTHYNNYIIFKQSFFHLVEGSDLYKAYPDQHWDLYKYSPTFAFLFGSLAWMPDGIGLLAWNLLNALMLVVGIRMLKLSIQQKNVILLLAVVELFTSLQNSQSNALIAGLIILAFALMEKEKFFLACLCIALTVYIKLFGLFAFAICLLYRSRWKMVLYSALAMMILAVLPLLIVSPTQLGSCYGSWALLLQQDYIPNYLSVVGVVNSWTGIKLSQNWILSLGLILILIPLVRIRYFDQFYFRLAFLAMLLLWMIVFNHKVESPTFVIALAGIGIWYTCSGLSFRWKIILALFALLFTSLSTTDLFPNFIQENVFERYSLKALPCIVIYFVSFYELTFKPVQLNNE